MVNTTRPKHEIETCRSVCPHARFDSDGAIWCDPPTGECLLETDIARKVPKVQQEVTNEA